MALAKKILTPTICGYSATNRAGVPPERPNPLEFSRNTQRWQSWHICITSHCD